MPTIKLTAGGKVITKSGKPTCTCCGCPQCDPETIEINWETYIADDPGPGGTYDSGTDTLTIGPATIATADDETNYGVPEGSCIVIVAFTFGSISGNLIWNGSTGSWSIDGVMASQDPTTRCDPSGVYEEYPGAPISITISIQP